jgi:hypothetical protein
MYSHLFQECTYEPGYEPPLVRADLFLTLRGEKRFGSLCHLWERGKRWKRKLDATREHVVEIIVARKEGNKGKERANRIHIRIRFQIL